jgi:hypothetical protein
MKKIFVFLALILPIVGLAQDRCPGFKVTKQRSGMHYELKKYKPKKLPREGVVVFAGGYVSPQLNGSGASGRVQMVEFGFSGGWDVRTTNPYMFKTPPEGESQYAFTNAFGATIGKYFFLGEPNNVRGLIDFGFGYGHSAHQPDQNKIPVFGYGLASYRVWRDIWISGSIHATDFQSTPRFSVGLATLIW